MTEIKRRTFFVISIVIFFAIAGFLVLYSRGYQWQWPLGGLVRTGGIFIRTNQNATHITINGLLKDTTRRIITDKGTLANRLIPQTYEIKITKESYQDWYKQLNVTPGIITEAKSVILFPKELPEEIIDTTLDNKLIMLDAARMAYFTQQHGRASRVLKIRFLSRPESIIFPLPEAFSNKANTINIVAASPSGNTLVLERINPKKQYISINTQTGKTTEFTFTNYNGLFFDASENLYVLLNNKAYMFNIETKQQSQLFNGKTLQAFGILQNQIWYIEATTSPSLIQTSLQGPSPTIVIARTITLPQTKTLYTIIPLADRMFLMHAHNETMLIANIQTNQITIIDEHVTRYTLDARREKILYTTKQNDEYALKTFFIVPSNEQPYKAAFSTETLTKTKEPIGDIAWFSADNTSTHAFFEVGNRMNVSELDQRDRRNSVILKENVSRFYYHNNTFTILKKDNSLVQSKLEL